MLFQASAGYGPQIIRGFERELQNCNTCDKYHHLIQDRKDQNRKRCVPNHCWCENGKAVPYYRCLYHNNHYCESCDDPMYELGEPEDHFIHRNEELYDNISSTKMKSGHIIKIRKCEGAKIDRAGFF